MFQRNLDVDQFEVHHIMREPDGTWGPTELISGAANARDASAVLDPNGVLHVVWEEIVDGLGDIAYRSRNADGSWNDRELIAPAEGISRQAGIVIDAAGMLQVVWIDARLGIQRVFQASAPATGGAWSEPRPINEAGATFPEYPDLSADGLGVVHVVWAERGTTDDTRFAYNLRHVQLQNGNASPPAALTQHGKVARRPQILAMPDGTLHLVWLDDRVGTQGQVFEVFYRRFLPGIGWGREKRFTYDGHHHGRPVIVPGPGNTLNLAWEDYRQASPDIYYRQIRPETGWDREVTQLTGDSSSSEAPALVGLPDGRLVMIWSDAQGTGTLRIYAKNGEVGSAP